MHVKRCDLQEDGASLNPGALRTQPQKKQSSQGPRGAGLGPAGRGVPGARSDEHRRPTAGLAVVLGQRKAGTA